MTTRYHFSPGDIVKLRSGGPPMTVVSIARDSKEETEISPGRSAILQCRWFSGTELRAATFPAESLSECPVLPQTLSPTPVDPGTPVWPS